MKVFRLLLVSAAVLLILISATVSIAPRLGLVIGEIGSGSMLPTLNIGELVIAQRTDPRLLKTGDIIVFRLSSTTSYDICHRIAAINQGSSLSFVTRGDNNNQTDGVNIPAANVIGKVTFHIPVVGYFIQFLKTPPGLIVGLIIPALWVAGICLLALRREINNLKKKADDSLVAGEHEHSY
jgi:signal peptidase I